MEKDYFLAGFFGWKGLIDWNHTSRLRPAKTVYQKAFVSVFYAWFFLGVGLFEKINFFCQNLRNFAEISAICQFITWHGIRMHAIINKPLEPVFPKSRSPAFCESRLYDRLNEKRSTLLCMQSKTYMNIGKWYSVWYGNTFEDGIKDPY